MKKLMLSILFLAIISFSACNKTYKSESSKFDIDNMLIKSKDSINYTINKETLTNNLHINSLVSIDCPHLNSNNKDFSRVYQLILKQVNDYININYGENYSDLALDIDYSITLNNDSLISIVFYGTEKTNTAAHPNNVFFSLNVDLNNSSKIVLKDIYKIDYQFAETYKKYLMKNSDLKVYDYCKNYNNDEIVKLFLSADDLESGIYSYFTDEKLGISLTIPHAIGDYVKTEIYYKDMC